MKSVSKLVLVGVTILVSSYSYADGNSDANTVTITGGPNGGCSPSMIHLEQGVEVQIVLKANKTKMFKMDAADLGIDLMAMPGDTDHQTITPANAGNFSFTCGVHGGPDSTQTHGTIMVM